MEWLCWLFGALLIVTLVGHGIWLLLAAIFSAGRQKPAKISAGRLTGAEGPTETRIRELLDAGLIDAVTYGRVASALAIARERHAVAPPVPVLPVATHAERSASHVEDNPTPPPPTSAPTAIVTPHPEPIRPPAPPAPPAPKPPRAPRRSFADVFAGFLRESNIRWGELVGGLLIIGCSVALVVSFWGQIAGRPFSEFGIFTGVTAAAFGLGLYAEHRWKLPTTSRGILLIATMLVPLNFLAFAALSHGSAGSFAAAAGEVAALGLFGFLVWQAARVLAPCWPNLLMIGVISLAASLPVTRHLAAADSLLASLALCGFPVTVYLATTGLMLRRARRWRQVRGPAAEAVFLLLGILTFAASLAIASLFLGTPDRLRLARNISPLLSLAAAPALATGLLLWRRVVDRRHAAARMIGTAIALFGAFGMLGCLALAWPDPRAMLPLAAIDFLVLTVVAVRFDLPVAHALATPCLSVAYVLGFGLAAHRIGWTSSTDQLTRFLTDPSLAAGVLPLFGTLMAFAWIAKARLRGSVGRPALIERAGPFYGWSAVAIGILSLTTLSAQDFALAGDPHGAAWLYLVYSAAAMLVARRFRHLVAGWAGAVLLMASFVQFFVTRTAVALPWPTALLAYAAIALAGAALRRADGERSAVIVLPARWTALFASLLAGVLLLFSFSLPAASPIALRLAALSAIWLAMALIETSEALFVAGQAAAALACALGVLANLAMRPWFVSSGDSLLEPWTIQSISVALAVASLAFALARVCVPRSWVASRWMSRAWAFDRVLMAGVFAAWGAIICGAFVEGLRIEFATGSLRPAVDAWAIHATGPGAWLLLALIFISLALAPREWLVRGAVPILTMLAGFACLLWAGGWAAQGATASAARWALAAMLLAGSIPIWARRCLPDPVAATLESLRPLLTGFAAVPILALSIYPASLTLAGFHPAGPDPACFFGRIENSASYVIPVAVVAVAFIGNAIRERSGGWALAGSAVSNLTVTLGYSLALVTAGQSFTAERVVHLLQLNIMVSAAFALGWQAIRSVARSDRQSASLDFQVALGLLGNALLLVAAAAWLVAAPGSVARLLAGVGTPFGFMAFALAAMAATWVRGKTGDRLTPAMITLTLFGAGLLVAASLAGNGNGWAGFHALMATAVIAGVLNVGAGILIAKTRGGWAQGGSAPVLTPVAGAEPIALQYERHDPATGTRGPAAIHLAGQLLRPAVLRWMAAASGVAVLLSVRAMAGDPQAPWWSTGITAAISLLWTALACWLLAPRLLYAGGLLLNLAATFWFVDRMAPGSAAPLFDLGMANVAVLAVCGLAALVLHLHVFTMRDTEASGDAKVPFHRFAGITSIVGVLAATVLIVVCDAVGGRLAPSPLLTWAALGTTLALCAATAWEADAVLAIPAVYALGLAAAALGLHELRYFHQPIQVGGAIAASMFVLVTGVVFAARDRIARLARSLGIPETGGTSDLGWLAAASVALLTGAIVLALVTDFTITQPFARVLAATSSIVGVGGLVLLARRAGRLDLCRATFTLLRIAAVAWGWSWLPPGTAWLTRAVVLLTVLGISLGTTVLVARRANEDLWTTAARRAQVPLAITWMAGLLATLGLEAAPRLAGETLHLAGWGIAAVLASALAGAAGGVALALSPRRDPLDLPPNRRGAYVYAAEGLLALAFLHLRLAAPWLFGGVLSQYWPLLVMGLAFGGVALGEMFRRRGTIALSSPLFATGAFLPLLPVVAFAFVPSHVGLASLLFTVGMFYAILSAARRSFAFGVMAALAANGALWSLLARQPAMAFLVHPQVWLIPAAASVLIAAQLNRDRLAPGQLRFVRYCCLMVVYISSTADIFLNGVKDHPALPLVLAGLSVAGVMLGILFRVRAFLFLGTSFLALSIVTMIYYASADLHWTWLWYVAGIALGATILVTFAMFEKKRAEMLALVDGLKRWS